MREAGQITREGFAYPRCKKGKERKKGTCWEQELRCGKGHEEGGSAYTKVGSSSGVPLEILEHLPPKPESAYSLLRALTYTSDFMGGAVPHYLSLKKELTYSSS